MARRGAHWQVGSWYWWLAAAIHPAWLVAGTAGDVALPTKQQQSWQAMEMGGLFQYNIGEYGTEEHDYACGNATAPMPAPAMFNPGRLNTSASVSYTHLTLPTKA